jgi:hypothetical protein
MRNGRNRIDVQTLRRIPSERQIRADGANAGSAPVGGLVTVGTFGELCGCRPAPGGRGPRPSARHAGERVEEVEIPIRYASVEQCLGHRHNAAAAPDATFDEERAATHTPDDVVAAVARALGEFSDAPVRTFVPTLVARAARMYHGSHARPSQRRHPGPRRACRRTRRPGRLGAPARSSDAICAV